MYFGAVSGTNKLSILPNWEMLLWQKQFCRCVLLQECFANGMEMLAYKYCQFLCHNESDIELFAWSITN